MVNAFKCVAGFSRGNTGEIPGNYRGITGELPGNYRGITGELPERDVCKTVLNLMGDNTHGTLPSIPSIS